MTLARRLTERIWLRAFGTPPQIHLRWTSDTLVTLWEMPPEDKKHD